MMTAEEATKIADTNLPLVEAERKQKRQEAEEADLRVIYSLIKDISEKGEYCLRSDSYRESFASNGDKLKDWQREDLMSKGYYVTEYVAQFASYSYFCIYWGQAAIDQIKEDVKDECTAKPIIPWYKRIFKT